MTPPDWASQRVSKAAMLSIKDGYIAEHRVARLLRLEHARAVRIIKKEIAMWKRAHDETPRSSLRRSSYEEMFKVLQFALTALQRGRTQKGTR